LVPIRDCAHPVIVEIALPYEDTQRIIRQFITSALRTNYLLFGGVHAA